jgi:hypothetical protein
MVEERQVLSYEWQRLSSVAGEGVMKEVEEGTEREAGKGLLAGKRGG